MSGARMHDPEGAAQSRTGWTSNQLNGCEQEGMLGRYADVLCALPRNTRIRFRHGSPRFLTFKLDAVDAPMRK